MSDRRRDAATAAVGYAGTGAAAGMRHEALVRAYDERGKTPRKRPPIAGELRMLKHAPGRKVWLAGAVTGAASLPAAATGTYNLLNKSDGHRSFLREGVSGARDAVVDRTRTVTEHPPPKLVAGNYVAGGAIGSATGGLTHLALRRSRVPGHGKAALAASAGILTGTAALPLQSKMTSRYTKGKYEVTSTGVRRAKTKPVRASSKASVYEGRTGNAARFRSQTVGKARRWPGPKPFKPVDTGLFSGAEADKVRLEAARVKSAKSRNRAAEMRRQALGDVEKMSPRTMARAVPKAYNHAGAKVGAHWTVQGLRAADVIDVPNRALIPKTKKGKLVHTGRTKAASAVRQAAFDVGSVNDKDAMMRSSINGHPLFGKRDDPGAGMSRAERRARVTASGVPIPIVGDVLQARTAARLAPEGRKGKSAGAQFAGGQLGGFTGNAVGAAGALGLARASSGFNAKARSASDSIDRTKATIRTKAGIKPGGQSLATRALASPRTPVKVRSAATRIAASPVGRAIARNPKVATVGALAGGLVGGAVGQQSAYGHAMRQDDALRSRRSAARQSYELRKFAKADNALLSRPEREQLARRKRHSAAMSNFGGAAGIGALAATLGGSALTHGKSPLVGKAPRLNRHLQRVQVPLLTAGAGVSGINAFTGAKIQRKEADQIRKAFGMPRLRAPRVPATPRLRAPTMRRGYLRSVRVPSGALKVSTVRGGLG